MAYTHGLGRVEHGWTEHELNGILFVRYMAERHPDIASLSADDADSAYDRPPDGWLNP